MGYILYVKITARGAEISSTSISSICCRGSEFHFLPTTRSYRKKLSGAEHRKRKAEESSKKENTLKNPLNKFSSNDNYQQASGSSAVSILMKLLIIFFFEPND